MSVKRWIFFGLWLTLSILFAWAAAARLDPQSTRYFFYVSLLCLVVAGVTGRSTPFLSIAILCQIAAGEMAIVAGTLLWNSAKVFAVFAIVLGLALIVEGVRIVASSPHPYFATKREGRPRRT